MTSNSTHLAFKEMKTYVHRPVWKSLQQLWLKSRWRLEHQMSQWVNGQTKCGVCLCRGRLCMHPHGWVSEARANRKKPDAEATVWAHSHHFHEKNRSMGDSQRSPGHGMRERTGSGHQICTLLQLKLLKLTAPAKEHEGTSDGNILCILFMVMVTQLYTFVPTQLWILLNVNSGSQWISLKH